MTTTNDISTEQSRVDDFNDAHFIGTWVRYWTGTRDDRAKSSRTATPAWLLGEHTAVVRVADESSCIALTHVDVIPGQPDDIEDDSHDLPEPARAAERVREYIASNGDGIYDVIDGQPLYARDLEALRRAGEQVDELTSINAELEALRPLADAAAAWRRFIGNDEVQFSEVEALIKAVDALPNLQEPCDICSGYGCPDCREDEPLDPQGTDWTQGDAFHTDRTAVAR
ncbi:hypothetical protein [Streptomyces sp.]|uniref:hypothetical protein n=1 Tax=Streptomyces sp. TaxID=1931 RepID=UPI002F95300A